MRAVVILFTGLTLDADTPGLAGMRHSCCMDNTLDERREPAPLVQAMQN
jgi:hypothetical protein